MRSSGPLTSGLAGSAGLLDSDEHAVNSDSRDSAQMAAATIAIVRADERLRLQGKKSLLFSAEKTAEGEWLPAAVFMASFLI